MSRKIISLLLTLVMIFAMMPAAFAAGAEETDQPKTYTSADGKVSVDLLRPGDTLEYGVNLATCTDIEAPFFQICKNLDDYLYFPLSEKCECNGIDELNKAWNESYNNIPLMVVAAFTDIFMLVPFAFDGTDAINGYGVFVSNGTELATVTNQNYTDVLKDGTVSYDPEKHVLTLKNANLSATNMPVIKSWRSELTIELAPNSKNQVTEIITSDVGERIYFDSIGAPFGDLTITGKGSLEIEMNSKVKLSPQYRAIAACSGRYDPIEGSSQYYRGNIMIDTCQKLSVNINGEAMLNSLSISAEDSLMINQSKLLLNINRINIQDIYNGVSIGTGYGILRITDSSIEAHAAYAPALISEGDILIKNSTVDADNIFEKGDEERDTFSQDLMHGTIYSHGKITIDDDSQVTASGYSGVECLQLTVMDNDSVVKGIGKVGCGLVLADANDVGIIPTLTVKGGMVQFAGQQAGILIGTEETDAAKVYALNGLPVVGSKEYNNFSGQTEASIELYNDEIAGKFYFSRIEDDYAKSIQIGEKQQDSTLLRLLRAALVTKLTVCHLFRGVMSSAVRIAKIAALNAALPVIIARWFWHF